MIILLIGLAGLGAWLTSGSAVFPFAAANAVGAFWGNGVMANYRDAPMAAPGWASAMSMLTALGAVIFVIVGLIV